MPVATSVIIPAHNAAGFLGEAIDSCLAQTLAALEVIVVDDGSTDATWEVAMAAAQRDPRVRPIRRPVPGGPGAARNAGLDAATGHWVAPLDADDLLLPDRLERLTREAERRGADLLADNPQRCDFTTGRALGRVLPPERAASGAPLGLLDLLRGDMPDQPSAAKLGYLKPLFRREFLQRHALRYRADIRVGEDFLLLFECVARGGRFETIGDAGYVYRLREGSVSSGRAGTLHLSAANRQMVRLARSLGATEVLALLRQRQRMIDFDSFAFEIDRGRPGAALGYAHWGSVSHALRQLRLAAGAARQRLAARA